MNKPINPNNLSNTFISYAQYNEDTILFALLSDVREGVYVDVGANYPTIDSVTKLFYEKGWHGINIEPIPWVYKLVQEERPDDINLNIGIGNKADEIDFFENTEMSGHSGFNQKELGDVKLKKYKVKINTLKQVFISNKIQKINFLKIDVEGFEDEAINGNDWSIYRPEVVCIESNHNKAKTSWQRVLTDNRYKLFIMDGLNEYYVAEESWYRTNGFADRAVSIDYKSLRQHQYYAWVDDIKQLNNATKLNKDYYNRIQKLNDDNKLSLRGVGYRERLKRSLKGLTVDWVRHKRSKN